MTMKKFMMIVATTMVALSSFAQGKATRVSGQLTDLGDSLLYNLIDMNLDNPRSKASYAVKDGKFDFTINVEHPATFALMDLASVNSGDPTAFKVIDITIMPGEDITINGNFSDYKIGGAAIYQKISDVQKIINDSYKNANSKNLDSCRKAFAAVAMPYIKAHSNDEAAMMLVQGLEYDQIKEAVALFSPEVREGRMAGFWKPMLKMYEAQAKREAAAKKLQEGTEAPDFTLPDINGKQLKLSSLRGKYVILDFWGSWCGWCIKGMPEMKKYYDKYKGKFEILGVDCNDTEAKWKAAVEKHQLPWKHVRQSKENQSVSDDYGIQGFPTKILIDPKGKIVKIIVGEDPEFYTLLDTTFGAKK